MSRYYRRASFYVIRVYYRGVRAAHYVKLLNNGRRRVMKGLRGAERFERERDGLWIVITNHWHGRPVVERGDEHDDIQNPEAHHPRRR
jgi:hypothetical protein